MVITGEKNIYAYHLLTLKAALYLEIKGMKHSSGKSVYGLIKKDFNLKGTKQEVYDQFVELLKNKGILKGGE